jgi:hypothetical protein
MYLCILDQGGQVVFDQNLPARGDAFLQAVAPFRDGLVVVMRRRPSASQEVARAAFVQDRPSRSRRVAARLAAPGNRDNSGGHSTQFSA